MSKKKNVNKDIEEALDRKDRMNVVLIGIVIFGIIPVILYVFLGQEPVEQYINQFANISGWAKLHFCLTGISVIYGFGALINAGISSRKEPNLIMAYNLFSIGVIGAVSYSLVWLPFLSISFATGMFIATGIGVIDLLTYGRKKKVPDRLGIRK